MQAQRSLVYFSPHIGSGLDLIGDFSERSGLRFQATSDIDSIHALMNRSFPACLVLDASERREIVLDLCRSLKSDAFTGIVPIVIFAQGDDQSLAADSLQAGADEVITDALSDREKLLRLDLVLRRAARDVSAHPTTRLPGTVQIERDLIERLASGQLFAVCYADLDHFKEFNDRYGYNFGDKVILLLSKILRDVVRALAPGGFVGHIGGDDFICNLPAQYLEPCCDEIITVFDELIPYQYTEEDRRAGYFLGKDRRGNVHRIPLMTLSIGVVTNQSQRFIHTAQVSELAAEMKSYAKTLPGSKYVVDRRHGLPLGVGAAGSSVSAAREAANPVGEDERPMGSGARPAPV
jgi:GGDEF domain-containing protein